MKAAIIVLSSVLLLNGCGSVVPVRTSVDTKEAASEVASVPEVKTEEAPTLSAEVAEQAAIDKESELGVYETKVLDKTWLYPSLEKALSIQGQSIDTMHAMIQRGFYDGMPGLEKGETVTVSSKNQDGYRYTQTADGKSGYMISTLCGPSKAEIKEAHDSNITVQALRTSIKENGQPKLVAADKGLVADGLNYQIEKVEYTPNVGQEGVNEGWAAADDGHTFAVLTCKVRNVSKDEQTLPSYPALLDKSGTIYPRHDIATFAMWELKHFDEPSAIKPGQTLKYYEAFYVPDSMPKKALAFTVPTSVSSKFQQKLALGGF